MLLITITATSYNAIENPDSLTVKCSEGNIEECAIFSFSASQDDKPVNIDDLYVYEIEEEVSINFDTKQYLPEGFNPLKGLGDLDWTSIELIELEEEVTIDFDTQKYLPENFNALEGLGDLDWSKIELIEIEEEVEIELNPDYYIPISNNEYIGM